MAHKGKVYPYFHARDLSMKPGGYTYLPARWQWSGILASGIYGSYFVGKTFTLDWETSVNPYGGLVIWRFSEAATPFQRWYVEVRYQLTRQPNMATITMEIGRGNEGFSQILPHDVTSSFPYNQLNGIIYSPLPARINIEYPGVLIPKPW